MTEYTEPTADAPWVLLPGDCLASMKTIPQETVDAVVTDPPYGLEFMSVAWDSFGDGRKGGSLPGGSTAVAPTNVGRWPANVVLDEAAAGALDAQSGTLKSGMMQAGQQRQASKGAGGYQGGMPDEASAAGTYGDAGGASRFFYCAKATKRERAGSSHPTVKPVRLMRWLVRLVTPPGGLVLDPFAGTGTTGAAAVREGMRVVMCEREPQYQADIAARMAALPVVGK